VFDDKFVDACQGMGWPQLHQVLQKASTSEFEDEALSAILLYGRGVLKTELADRLLYTCVALEGLVHRNSTEPLTQNIADRLAFALESTREGRLRVVDIVRKAYDARSRFVHHGDAPKELDVLTQFSREVWKFFVHIVVPGIPRFKTKLEFIDAIDAVKYS
jgi:hypothetical protein